MANGNQEIVRGSPKYYNSYAQNFQLKQPPHHREESGTEVASSLTPQYQDLFIDTSPRFLPLHTALTLRESIVARFSGQKNARNPKGGTEDGIEDSDKEGFQDDDGITPSSKEVLLVSQKEERNLKAIQWNEEVLIDEYRGSKDKYLLKESELILHYPSHTDFCNEK